MGPSAVSLNSEDIFEDTSNDGAIARLLEMLPPSPSADSSSSSNSTSSSSSEHPVAEVAEPAAVVSMTSSSTSSSATSSALVADEPQGAQAKLDQVTSMGFSVEDAVAALQCAHGSVEDAVRLLCEG